MTKPRPASLAAVRRNHATVFANNSPAKVVHPQSVHDRVPGEATPDASHRKDFSAMARRRFQTGSIRLRGKKEQVWVAKWREDVIELDGSVRRIQKGEVLGTLAEYKTKRLAERALQQRLAEVNSITYKPSPTATFQQFADRWHRDVLTQHKRSTQSGDRSRIKLHLIPAFGEMCMKDITSLYRAKSDRQEKRRRGFHRSRFAIWLRHSA